MKAWETTKRSNEKIASPEDGIALHFNFNTIRMQKAVGGTIVEITSYNISTDNTKRNLYVIPDSSDISTELKSILFLNKLTED